MLLQDCVKIIVSAPKFWIGAHDTVINSFFTVKINMVYIKKYDWLIFKEYSNIFNIPDIWLPVCIHKALF